MKVTPIVFCGQKEIQNYANQYGPLKKDETNVEDLALKIHDLNPDITSDGVYCSSIKDQDLAERYTQALKALTMPSAFGFHCAVDTLKAPIYEALPNEKNKVRETALEIAKNSPEVTKYDILKNWLILTK